MFCSYCGASIDDNAEVCIHCGHMVTNSRNKTGKEPVGILVVLSFFVPVAGLVLYFVYKDEYEDFAKKCLKWALIAIGVRVVLAIVLAVVYALLSASFLRDLPYYL